jgi:hypothetical protein
MRKKENMMSGRQRGITMLEGILYLGLATSVIGFSTSFILQEQERQEEVMIAREYALVMEGAQDLVSSRYDELLEDLYDEAALNGSARLRYDVPDLIDLGFLPASFLGGAGALDRTYGQEFRLLLRAVSVDDASVPQTTLTLDDMDPGGANGDILAELVDGDLTNDEARIEAVLVSAGGEAVPVQVGAPVTGRTERSNAGFVESGTEARGPYGVFSFDLGGFVGADGFPDDPAGRFAAIVALGAYGVLDASGRGVEGSDQQTDLSDAFRRCEGILDDPSFDQNSPIYVTCRDTTNDVYSDIVIMNYDATGDGVPDVFPVIEGASRITMSPPVDTTGDGVPDVVSAIENLRVIGCGAVAPGTGSDAELTIDCDLTRMTGTVIAQNYLIETSDGPEPLAVELEVAGNQEVQVSADRFLMGDKDLTNSVLDVQILASGQTIEKPVCPPTTADGAFLIEPRVYVLPTAFADPDGRSTVGMRAFAEDSSPTDWTVRLYQYVAQDICTFTFAGGPYPAPGNCTYSPGNPYNPDEDPALGNPDGVSDAYEVGADYGRVLAMTRCF